MTNHLAPSRCLRPLAAALCASLLALSAPAHGDEPPPADAPFATPPGLNTPWKDTAPPVLTPPPPPPKLVAEPEPAPYEPPPPAVAADDAEADDYDGSYDGAPFPESPRVSLSIVRLVPERFGNATGGLLAIDIVGITDDDGSSDDFIGFAGDMGLAIGLNSDGNIPFDSRMGFGFGLMLGPLRIAPLVGVGADTMGGGDGGFTMDGAFYWLVEGRARLAFEGLGLEGFGGRFFRGNITGDRATDVPRETRAGVQAFTSLDGGAELFLGGTFVDFGDAQALGAHIGFGARRD